MMDSILDCNSLQVLLNWKVLSDSSLTSVSLGHDFKFLESSISFSFGYDSSVIAVRFSLLSVLVMISSSWKVLFLVLCLSVSSFAIVISV